MSPDDPRHGTNAGYIAGCRDECCRTAHADYKRRLRSRRYLRRVDAFYIDATGARRRIQALMALGWTYRDVNRAAGWSTSHVGGNAANILQHQRVHVDTAERVKAAYDELSMRLPTGRYVNRQRRIAASKGWLVPLMWDDDRIDDPTYTPPRPRADRRGYRGHLAAEVAHLRATGVSLDQAAKQLGVTVGAVERAMERARSAERQAS